MATQNYDEKMVVRKGLDFQLESDDIPKYWMAGDVYKTRMMDAVQATFPDGERYFISTVRAFRDDITDPQMKHDVADFMMQEGQHGKVHTQYNDRLARQGIKIKRLTDEMKRINEIRLRRYSAKYNVALTAAFEHFTAMMADLFFADKKMLAGADERVRAMLAWHAVEEMEHKSVAYDVMQKVAKVGYLRRILAMSHAIFSFIVVSIMLTNWFLKDDGYSWRQRQRITLKAMPWTIGHMLRRLIPMVLIYYKPGFHPQQMKSVHNYPDWRDSYAETGDPVKAGEAMYAAAYS